MNWDNTVMDDKQMTEVARDCWRTEHTYPKLVARKQAEISFKAGVKKVVDWIDEHKSYLGESASKIVWEAGQDEWQAFLKECEK